MNKALFIISLQHELAMAIGNKLDLKPMLKVFMKVCFSRLNLTSAHIYMHSDQVNMINRPLVSKNTRYKHLLSIPKRKQNDAGPKHNELKAFVEQLSIAQCTISNTCDNGQYFFGFIIPEHGLLIFETHYEIESEVLQALSPILQKLATSCYTSLVHDSLVKEITTRERIEKKIAFQAQHDGLTGLFNRQHLQTLLADAIEDAQSNNKVGCVIFIDLNRFKPINDAMGHSVGDKILQKLAKRLNSLSNECIDVARFGGDEFIVLLKGLGSDYQKNVFETIDKISLLINTAFIIKTNSYKLSCSIGYALYPRQSSTVNNLIKFADIAMYEAKRKKSKQGIQYTPLMSGKIQRRLSYVDDMKRGLENDDFRLFYQPQYNQNGNIIGAEALLRWHHPQYGVESPAVYIPIAEESDLILQIGQWVLEQACRDIHKIEQLSLPDSFKKVSINVSAKQLIQHDFQDKVMYAIKQNNLSENRLALELTENLLVESIEDSIKLIASLKANNIDCSIDDFGTGYSSLTYLKRIPASLLKIDRSFVSNIEQSNQSIAIASMIISLGKALNMDILAEGVETAEELKCLKQLGCYQYQGFYFSKAVPLDEFIGLLEAHDVVS